MNDENKNPLESHEDLDFLYRYEKSRRYRIAITIIPLFFGIIGIIAHNMLTEETLTLMGLDRKTTIPIFIIMSFAVSGASLLMIYLQTGFSKINPLNIKTKYYLDHDYQDLEKFNKDLAYEEIKEHIHELEQKLTIAFNQRVDLNDEEKTELVQELEQSIKEAATGNIIKDIKEQVKIEAKRKSLIIDFQHLNNQSISRLANETISLARRANVNLVIGIATTIIGLTALSYFVLSHETTQQDATSEFINYFIPRFTLVIFIQVFAFFFLKLYRATLDEIKFFQNEITNIEMISISLRASFEPEMQNAAPEILKAISKTERNYIIPKGQTTISLERDRNESAQMENMIKQFVELTKAMKK